MPYRKTYDDCTQCGGTGVLSIDDISIDCDECIDRYIDELHQVIRKMATAPWSNIGNALELIGEPMRPPEDDLPF